MVNNIKYQIYQAGLYVSLFCFFLIILSCSKKDPILASIDDKKLRESEAYLLMNHLGYDTTNENDLVRFVDFWIERQLYISELNSFSPQKMQLIDLRAEMYKGEIAGFYFEQQKTTAALDTLVTDEEIQKYYSEYGSQFELQDYIVKALYVKVPVEAKDLDKLKETFLLKKDKDLTKVNSYAKLYAEDYYFDDSVWIYFNELTKNIPFKKINKDNLIMGRTKTHFSDDQYVYFLNIIDFKLKDSKPPLEFLKQQIKEIILTNRIYELRQENNQTWIKQLKKKHEINIYI